MNSSLVIPSTQRVVSSANMTTRKRGSPFDRYDIREEVREQSAKSPILSDIERLRKAREMLRSLPPEQAFELIEFHDNLDFFQAMELAKKLNALIVPNDVIDRILMEANLVIPLWLRTGTLIIFENLNIAFTDAVQYDGIIFKVPSQFRGKANCALVVENPDFELVGNEILVPDETKIHLLEDFPIKNDTAYMPHARTGVPHGREVDKSKYTKSLNRFFCSYLNHLIRCGYYFGHGLQFVDANRRLSSGCGVALLPLGKLGDLNV